MQNLMVEITENIDYAKSDGWSCLKHWRTKNLMVEVSIKPWSTQNLMVEVAWKLWSAQNLMVEDHQKNAEERKI